MGGMRFLVHSPITGVRSHDLLGSYCSALDGRVVPCQIWLSERELVCERQGTESVKLNVIWRLRSGEDVLLSTTSLRDRNEPYSLALELARGKLAEIRESLANWVSMGMVVPDVVTESIRNSFNGLTKAGTCGEHSPFRHEQAVLAIEHACEAANLLCDSYVIQRQASNRRQLHHAPRILGCVVNDALANPEHQQIFHQAFNSISLPFDWKEVEVSEGGHDWSRIDEIVNFAQQNRLLLKGGPVVDLSPGATPDWLIPWKKDFKNLPCFLCDFVETSISRYNGVIRLWEVASSGNLAGGLDLGEDQCLALTAKVLEAAHRTDADAQYFIRIDSPWGEYQRHGANRLTPFQFVDAIVRSNLGLTGVTLEITKGYGTEGCYPRDLLAISKLIDLWSQLQIQIHVNLACPSASGIDPLANPRFEVASEHWNDERQARWVEGVIPLLLAKPTVTGIYLSQFSDGVSHRFPHAGLIGANDQPKLLLETMAYQMHHDMA
ncbi:endo-1,4-beta-xylanase [Planctomicrobium sp. SH668]|uniref:endo-1,4-beta-xylanase n=1 Tax=Planctomicrobium sp. SH668 TaxID=3448126 RepID=UPI003F5C0ECE